MFDLLITQPVFNLLLTIYSIVGDFGVSIIIFTIIVKTILWPMTKAQLHQTRLMRDLQPELKKIKKNSKGNKQIESLQMMELYKKNNIKPFRSLLSLIVQIPILFTLNHVIRVTVNHSDQLGQFTYSVVQDLPRVSDMIENPDNFKPYLFGTFDLTTTAVPVNDLSSGFLFMIAVVSAVLQWYTVKQQQPKSKNKRRLRDIMAEAAGGKEPDQAEINQLVSKQMSFMLPLMIFTTMINLYGAINLYFFINNLLHIIQQRIILEKDKEDLQEMADKPLRKRAKQAQEAQIVKKTSSSSKNKNQTNITRIKAKDSRRKGRK